ncbi:MAG TPA: hypothetical protein ENJ18_18200 [Nannocystis exedens]|nr:hypothetical protein [Nannocystis exedens]
MMMPNGYVCAASATPDIGDEVGEDAEGIPSEEAAEGAEDAVETPSAANQQVELRNGGHLGGEIVEVLPGESLTIISSATGQSKTIAWGEVARYTEKGEWVEMGGAAAAAPAGAVVAEEPGSTLRGSGPRVHIDVKGGRPMSLFQITSKSVATGSVGGSSVIVHGMTYNKICAAPCDQVVDLKQGDQFFVSGKRVSGSKAFSIAPDQGDLTVSVKPGRQGVLLGGFLIAPLGFSSLLAGAIWYPIAKRYLAETGDPNLKPAIGMMIGGGIALVGGVAMVILGKTRLEFRGGGLGLLRPLHFG